MDELKQAPLQIKYWQLPVKWIEREEKSKNVPQYGMHIQIYNDYDDK